MLHSTSFLVHYFLEFFDMEILAIFCFTFLERRWDQKASFLENGSPCFFSLILSRCQFFARKWLIPMHLLLHHTINGLAPKFLVIRNLYEKCLQDERPRTLGSTWRISMWKNLNICWVTFKSSPQHKQLKMSMRASFCNWLFLHGFLLVQLWNVELLTYIFVICWISCMVFL